MMFVKVSHLKQEIEFQYSIGDKLNFGDLSKNFEVRSMASV